MVMRNDTDPEPNEPGRRASVSSFVQLYPLPTDRPPAQWALGRHEVQIGRDVAPQRGIRIDSPRVSSLHATVIKTGSGYVLRDCESTNGTFVNLHKIDSHRLCPGDVIRIAGTLFLYREEVPMTYPKHPEIEQIIWGNSAPIRALRHQIAQLAQSSDSVLILGETGTGKELVAQALHKMSKRTGALVAINCAAITTDLAESILFGHLRGAFTGATRDQSGCFRDAERGTLFLDEFGELSPDLQAKVLRVLETKHIRRIGASSEEKIDVRVVAATNRDLRAEVKAGRFRADLYHRLSVFTITLPPLRDLGNDKLTLLDHYCGEVARQHGTEPFSLDGPARIAWLAYGFPGNVRELKNIVIRLLAKHAGYQVGREDLLAEFEASPDRAESSATPALASGAIHIGEGIQLGQELARIELQYIDAAIATAQGNMSQAARLLGISRSTLYSRLDVLRPGRPAAEGENP